MKDGKPTPERYELSVRGMKWQEHQRDLERSVTALFDWHVVDIANIFADIMGLLHAVLDRASLSGSKLQVNICIGILSQAYQQLLSSWRDTRAGRLSAAYQHWRSLWEIPAYLWAIFLDRKVAERWGKGKRITRDEARLAVHQAIAGLPQEVANKWMELESVPQWISLQPFAHVTSNVASGAFLAVPGTSSLFSTPEGAYSDHAKDAAIMVVKLAFRVLTSAQALFGKNLGDAWNVEVDRVRDIGIPRL